MSDNNQNTSPISVLNPASLNDAAAFLLQLDPSDLSESVAAWSRLLEMLTAIADDNSYPELCREKIARAAVITGKMTASHGSEADSRAEEAILKIGQLIESAMNVMDEKEKVAEHRPLRTEEKSDAPEEQISDSPGSGLTRSETGPSAEAISDLTGFEAGESAGTDAKSCVSATEAVFLPGDADPELISAFITESTDLIVNAEEALLSLERNPENADAVNTVFRAFHTVKGTSAFLELTLISEMAHHAESFLSRIRNREIRYAGGYTDLALRSVDMLKELVQSVQSLAEGQPFLKPTGYDELMVFLSNPEKAGISDEEGEESPLMIPRIGDILVARDKAERKEVEAVAATVQKDEKPIGVRMVQTKTASLLDVAKGLRTQQQMEGAKHLIESSVRVPVERLDRFIDMVGELVVAHSMVAQDEIVMTGGHHELSKKVALTAKIVRELQNMSMSMRMVPLKPTFQKMARLVRDLARKAGKEILFEAQGEDTEIDRNMVDIIADPLVHMVRNAVDHGIESPEIREKLGKPRQGTILLSARHSAGNVVVEITDDGKGLDRSAIIAKAVETGLLPENTRPETLTEREVFSLIFEPGFSTAEAVSEVSGRGVGMNVVKINIEILRGQIDIQSELHSGSTFSISLPLTLAIIDGMVVRVGAEKYVMPTISIVRSVRPDTKAISTVHNRGQIMRLQGRLIPLFRLAAIFGIEGTAHDPAHAIVVVVEDGGKQAGIVVDELIGSQQIVIKTLGEIMRNIPGISGSAIMPDGKVGLILDVGGLVKLANSGTEN
jgi:two-component system chemotaxis sensor kinase CheA